jgi:1-acyl-sn-glycerol-3-phosphate acyltransferase
LSKLFFSAFFRLVYRVGVEGLENIPKRKGLVICSTQMHVVDLLIIASLTKRNLKAAAPPGWRSRLFETIPLGKRAIDMNSYKAAMLALRNGEAIVIKASGPKGNPFSLASLNKDAVMFGAKAQAPFLPIEISSTYRLFSPVKISIGKPFMLERSLSEIPGKLSQTPRA